MITDISLVAVESWDVEKVIPYPMNHKIHPPKHISLLTRSIKAQGLLDPIVVDEAGVIISGHGRFEAIKALEWVKVPVRVLRGITDEQASALRIAANKTVSNEYDVDVLTRELQALSQASFDLLSLGFDDRELTILLEDVGVLDTEKMVDDLDSAIAAHDESVAEKTEETDKSTIRLDQAFGFKRVSLRHQKTFQRFIAEVHAASCNASVEDALVAHMKSYLDGIHV